jgi:hypothetical protein
MASETVIGRDVSRLAFSGVAVVLLFVSSWAAIF